MYHRKNDWICNFHQNPTCDKLNDRYLYSRVSLLHLGVGSRLFWSRDRWHRLVKQTSPRLLSKKPATKLDDMLKRTNCTSRFI